MSQPWMKFYSSDWRADPALRMCSIAARGLWIEMICLMNEAAPYGSLVVNGRPLGAKQVASLAGIGHAETEKLLKELEEAGVFSREYDDTIFSRRMRRDYDKSLRDKENGKGGGNPILRVGVNPPLNGGDKAQIPDARYQIPEEERNLTVSCPKRVRTRVGYSDEFEVFWTAYPTDAGMAKKEAFTAWQKLAADDRLAALKAVPAWKAHSATIRDYRMLHACRYLSQRRFEGLLEVAERVGTQVFVKIGSAQWRAWEQSQGKSPPVNKEGTGWWFKTEWPTQTASAA